MALSQSALLSMEDLGERSIWDRLTLSLWEALTVFWNVDW